MDFLFYIALALFITHEIDAVRRREWLMIGGLSRFRTETGFIIFAVLHIPLFVFIFWGLLSGDVQIKYYLVLILDIFFILHFMLHFIFINHLYNEFNSAFSWIVIIGMSVSGFLHLIT